VPWKGCLTNNIQLKKLTSTMNKEVLKIRPLLNPLMLILSTLISVSSIFSIFYISTNINNLKQVLPNIYEIGNDKFVKATIDHMITYSYEYLFTRILIGIVMIIISIILIHIIAVEEKKEKRYSLFIKELIEYISTNKTK
jgi:hypothetical protein